MKHQKYTLLAKAYNRNKLIAVGINDYKKSHPLMHRLAQKVGLPKKIFLHAEVLALLRCKEQVPTKVTVERYNQDGEMALAKPCPICMEAMKLWGVKQVEYTSKDGWITCNVD